MKLLNENEDEKIQTIFHLSDIHIRLYHRLDDEYEHVFQQMYRLLKESRQQDEKCLIVLTGDILHHKNDLSPECILATLKFLNTLSSYYPTLFIAGNHDTLLNNLNRIDSLSAILAENHNTNLHYLKYSGWYRYANVVFGVSSLLDEKMTLAKDLDCCSSWKKIALYHGGVGKFSTNKGFLMEGIPMSTFDGYDMVMLGDIHLHQYLDKQKRIAYAGSMIAQNFGETDPDHGVLKWDVDTGASSLIVLDNPYRYCEAVLKNDNSVLMDGNVYPIDKAPFPEKGRLKIFLEQKTVKEIQVLTHLRNRHPSLQFHENVNMVFSKQPSDPQSTPSTFLGLLQEYFATLPDDWEDKPKLMEIITSFFKDNLSTKTSCASHFEILNLEFDYMFGYGPHNKIDFSQFQKHETIGIFGMNSAGKSTLIDVMLFLLYGSITRYKHSQTVPPEVIHFHQKKSSGTIRFRSHNITYEIQKKMSRSTNGKIKVDEKLFKVHPDGTKLDLSEEHRRKTDKFVVSQIGTPTQFLFTNIFLQTNEQSFRSMTPKDRKDFLYDILELSQLEQHYQENYSKWKDSKILLDQLEKELQQLHVAPEQIHNTQQELFRLKEQKEEHETTLSSLQKQIREKLSTKKPCPLSTKDMEQQKQIIQNNIEKLETEQQALEQEKKKQLSKVQPELLEQTRNELWQSIELLCKKLQPLPVMDASSFRLRDEQELCPYLPTLGDVSCFRQDVYDQFLTGSKPILDHIEKEEDITIQKEKLLSSLYPEPDPTTDTPTLQKELETLEQQLTMKSNIASELMEATQHLSLLEADLLDLDKEWSGKWEEWDELQKEPDMVRFMSGLRFNDKCRSCSHNGATLQSCLLEAEQFKQQKLRLWEAISPSKEKRSQIKQTIADARKKVAFLQQQQQIFQQITRLQHVLNNRTTRNQLSTIKIQQHWIKVKKVWEETKHVAEQRTKIQENNDKMEQKIGKKKQKVSSLDHQRRMLDQWKETIHQLEKERNKLVELTQWEQNMEENNRLDCWVHEKEQEEEEVKSKLKHDMDAYILKQQEFNLLKQQMEKRKKKETQYHEIQKEHELLTRLLQILHRDGLPMYFLEQYLPQLENRINELISPFLKQKKIVLRKEQKKETVNILLSVSTLGSETNYLGGMEGFIVDASIKEVLAEISLQCKSNLFIIDEGISALDKKNMENLDQFFHFLEERHPHVFIISHLSEAQHIVRHCLQISKVGDYSKIEYV